MRAVQNVRTRRGGSFLMADNIEAARFYEAYPQEGRTEKKERGAE